MYIHVRGKSKVEFSSIFFGLSQPYIYVYCINVQVYIYKTSDMKAQHENKFLFCIYQTDSREGAVFVYN